MRAFLRRTEGPLLCLTPRWVCACVRKDGRGTMGELCPVVFQISSVVTSLDDFKASLWEAFLSLLENPKIRRINCNQETTDLEVTTWTQDFMSPKFAVVAHGNRSACGDGGSVLGYERPQARYRCLSEAGSCHTRHGPLLLWLYLIPLRREGPLSLIHFGKS